MPTNMRTKLPERLCLTGGGSAGHVMPHLALLPQLNQAGCKVLYIGTRHGIEKTLLQNHPICFRGIVCGKLRRYFDWRTFIMPLAVITGFVQALWHLACFKPKVVFSKGGYVALPVVAAAWLLRIPCVAHESDSTLGLCNRLCLPLVKKMCLGFEATAQDIAAKHKVIYTGIPVREALLHGNAKCGLAFTGLDHSRPIVLVFGGSLGARAINKTIRDGLAKLLTSVQIIHIAGPGYCAAHGFDENTQLPAGYALFDFINEALPDVMACADIAITRAGANTLAEWVALAMPSILIPLPATTSRGDQLHNARHFAERGLSLVIEQSELTAEHLNQTILHCLAHRDAMRNRLIQAQHHDSAGRLLAALTEV